MSAKASENGFGHVGLLPTVEDDHGGLIVEMEEKDAMDRGSFVTALRASLLIWKKQGIKGVWIKLPIGLVNLVEAAVQEGFWYHNAEPTYLMLVYWLPGTASTIPQNASHQVSVGAVVLKDKREILVVKEKTGQFQRANVWKIPTGVVDEGEDICEAAVREVKEETGIDTEFLEVLAFRRLQWSTNIPPTTPTNPNITDSSKTTSKSHSVQITAIRLNGDNILRWSQSVRMYMRCCGKMGYLTGERKAPEEDVPTYATWDAENSMVMTWLVNSMEEEISSNFMCYPTAKELWENVIRMYSDLENQSQIFELNLKLGSSNASCMFWTDYCRKCIWQWGV